MATFVGDDTVPSTDWVVAQPLFAVIPVCPTCRLVKRHQSDPFLRSRAERKFEALEVSRNRLI